MAIKKEKHYIPLADAIIYCEIASPNNDFDANSNCSGSDATTILFLHGNGEDLRIFDQQINCFSQYYRTIAIDTRAHGKSTRGTKPLDFHTFAADLIDVLDVLKIEKVIIVGFSDGAITALHTALLAPERISVMVLLGVNYNTNGLLLKYRLQVLLVYACLSVVSLFSGKIRKRKEIWKLMVNLPKLTIGEISQITIPTLVVTGENDMVCQRHNDEISNAIKGSQRLVIQGGDHFWLFKQANLFNDYIMKYFQNYQV